MATAVNFPSLISISNPVRLYRAWSAQMAKEVFEKISFSIFWGNTRGSTPSKVRIGGNSSGDILNSFVWIFPHSSAITLLSVNSRVRSLSGSSVNIEARRWDDIVSEPGVSTVQSTVHSMLTLRSVADKHTALSFDSINMCDKIGRADFADTTVLTLLTASRRSCLGITIFIWGSPQKEAWFYTKGMFVLK